MWEMEEIIENDYEETEVESPEIAKVRGKLLNYAAKPNTRLTNIESYIRIYIAIQDIDGRRSDLFALTKAYETRYGESIPKSTLCEKIKRMRKMGI